MELLRADALEHDVKAPIRARYNVLGVPLDFATNDPDLAVLAEESFGGWGAPDPNAGLEPVRLRILLQNVAEISPVAPHENRVLRVRDGSLSLAVGQSRCYAEREGGFANALLTPALLADRALTQMWFFDCLAIYLACRYRRATLHAAGLAHRGRGVLLTGSNGVGKSTLAYACLRAGFQFLADDVVFAVEQTDPVRVWGNPWYLHLLPDTARFFPELAEAERALQLNGETKLRIHVNGLRSEAALPYMPVFGVLTLSRAKEGETRLQPADPARVQIALTGFQGDPPLDRAAMESAVDRLLAGRIAHLEIGSDLSAAVRAIRDWMEE